MMSCVDDETNVYSFHVNKFFKIQRAFHQFDVNHNGFITDDEVHQCLWYYYSYFNDFNIPYISSQMSYNQDEQVSCDEYMRFMSKIN
ncbi:unnamed protein product [Rotaria sordida]|uniref:EF-hand domain-containing protein n=1 Tax=Rotaria sordida TaxID=392033 RepID=A0A814D0L6_9BILA|nr:unnamed protein product [Rotaria sordida]